jgi:hypothetical protein
MQQLIEVILTIVIMLAVTGTMTIAALGMFVPH